MDLLEDSVDVDGESFGSLMSSLWGWLGMFSWGVSSGFSGAHLYLFKLLNLLKSQSQLPAFKGIYFRELKFVEI